MGFTPQEVGQMSLRQFFDCIDGYKRANGVEEKIEPMTAERFDELREKFRDK